MPSEYIKDLVDHKERVAKYMQIAAGIILEKAVDTDISPKEQYTLMDLLVLATSYYAVRASTPIESLQLSPSLNRLVTFTMIYFHEHTGIHATILDLFHRASVHDNSKFSPEEFEAYEAAFPGLQKYAYGTPEFKAELAKIKPAIRHHYAVNDHHPEYHELGGVNDMHLVQLIEMTCDWIAASERSQTDIIDGLEKNKERFGIDEDLFMILKNTADCLQQQPPKVATLPIDNMSSGPVANPVAKPIMNAIMRQIEGPINGPYGSQIIRGI